MFCDLITLSEESVLVVKDIFLSDLVEETSLLQLVLSWTFWFSKDPKYNQLLQLFKMQESFQSCLPSFFFNFFSFFFPHHVVHNAFK